jgi:hypothetical protein
VPVLRGYHDGQNLMVASNGRAIRTVQAVSTAKNAL